MVSCSSDIRELTPMKVSKGACDYLTEKATEFKEPVIVLFEQIYRGWCGVSKVTSVVAEDKANIEDPGKFSVKKVDGCNYPIYLQKGLESIWGRAKIDVAGWSTYRRLVVLEE